MPGLFRVKADLGVRIGTPGDALPGEIEVNGADRDPAGQRGECRLQQPVFRDSDENPPVRDLMADTCRRHVLDYVDTFCDLQASYAFFDDLFISEQKILRERKKPCGPSSATWSKCQTLSSPALPAPFAYFQYSIITR